MRARARLATDSSRRTTTISEPHSPIGSGLLIGAIAVSSIRGAYATRLQTGRVAPCRQNQQSTQEPILSVAQGIKATTRKIQEAQREHLEAPSDPTAPSAYVPPGGHLQPVRLLCPRGGCPAPRSGRSRRCNAKPARVVQPIPAGQTSRPRIESCVASSAGWPRIGGACGIDRCRARRTGDRSAWAPWGAACPRSA
jgi:hypothetical protein